MIRTICLSLLAVGLPLNRVDSSWILDVQPISSPAASNSAQPQLSGDGHGVVLSWIERTGDLATLKFSERTPGGWTDARAAASGTNWFVNWADVPSVVRLADRSLVAHWLQKSGPDTYAYDVRLSRSTDDGRTWSAPFTPHHDGTKTEHGFASLFQTPGAGLGLVWLDGRATKASSDHGGEGVGEMSLRAATFDANGAQRSEDAIDLRVCECCPTAVAVTSDGPIVAFRDRGADELRNIAVSRLVGGKWTAPAAVHDDGWRINGCPVNGPSLSASGRDVAIAWFTAPNDRGHAYLAFSSDAGRRFGAPIQIDEIASIGRVDVDLLPDGSAVAAWIELANQRADFKARRVDRSGQRSPAVTIATITANRNSGYPRMARRGGELLFAWVESKDGSPRVQTAAARLP